VRHAARTVGVALVLVLLGGCQASRNLSRETNEETRKTLRDVFIRDVDVAGPVCMRGQRGRTSTFDCAEEPPAGR
jgi:hypothetical protein